LAGCSGHSTPASAPPTTATPASPPASTRPETTAGIHKIKHVVVIMQENRSFDSYFGTYRGADGIPPGVCVANPRQGHCEQPFVDPADSNGGGPHGADNARNDVNGGKMSGFVIEAERAAVGCRDVTNPACTNSPTPDVMGYHTASDIPNYWAYARDFV